MKNTLWKFLGFILLGLAYIGVITPGIPFSIFIIGAAFCFSEGSPIMHSWLYNHKLFGPFLTNWAEKKVFPTKMKFMMIAMMSSSVAIMWFTTYNIKAVAYAGTSMVLVAIWAWRYPGNVEIYNNRVLAGNRIGWFK